MATQSEPDLPGPDDTGRAAELTRLLARASLLPAGARTRDVGGYRAMEVMALWPGHYWATADVIDEEGSGHLEMTVAGGGSPLTLDELRLYGGTTGAERLRPDGSLLTTCTTRSIEPDDSMIFHRAILARPDGTYVDVISSNQDGRTGGRGRPTPPLDAGVVLDKIADLRP